MKHYKAYLIDLDGTMYKGTDEIDGAIVNENDLVHALNTGQILACGLDVLEQEPIEEQHPLLKMPNVVIVPHIGSASEYTRDRMVQLCVDNIKAVLNNEPAITPVSS